MHFSTKISKTLCDLKHFIEPVKLIGEGMYNLNAVKEIEVTDSFLGMSMEVKECQNEEDLQDCTTRNFRDNFLKKCGCTPYGSLASFEKVIN